MDFMHMWSRAKIYCRTPENKTRCVTPYARAPSKSEKNEEFDAYYYTYCMARALPEVSYLTHLISSPSITAVESSSPSLSRGRLVSISVD
jgi:hypothetical protein